MVTTSDDAWLEAFFGEGNAWDLEKIRNAGYEGVLQSHLETMLQPCLQNRMPFILPRIDADEKIWFYVIGEDRRQLAELQRIVMAYLGNVLTSLDPRIFVTSDDPIENSLLSKFSHGFSMIGVPQELNSDKPVVFSVLNTLNSAIERYSQRPSGFSLTQRPTGRILSDFFIACGRSDGEAASEYCDELKATGNLSSRNLVSIELQALAAGGHWQDLLNHPRLPYILGERIPGVISDLVLDAVQHLLVRSDAPGDHEIARWQDALQGLSALFLRKPNLDPDHKKEYWKVWSMGAAALGFARILEVVPVDLVGKNWIDQLAQWAGLKVFDEIPIDPIESALQAEQSFENAVILLQQSLTVNQQGGLAIYQRLLSYPPNVFEEITAHGSLLAVWKSLESDYSVTSEIDSWSSWLSSLVGESKHDIAVHSIAEVCRNWRVEKWDEGLVIEQLYELAGSESSSIVRDVVPIMRTWLLHNNVVMPAEFIEQIILMLAVDDIYSVQDLLLFSELINDLAGVPHTEQQYKETITAAKECWALVKSVNSLEQGLEIMDVLLDSVCADLQSRLNYWYGLQEFCIANWNRLADDQQLIVLRTSEDATGSSDQFPPTRKVDEGADPELVDLANKKLAIYTLTEGAARRAGMVLTELFPGIDIRLNHDKSATSALVNLADTADYFIFASKSAAHQAFYPVTKRRGDILYPSGKGSSSIVRCFMKAVLE